MTDLEFYAVIILIILIISAMFVFFFLCVLWVFDPHKDDGENYTDQQIIEEAAEETIEKPPQPRKLEFGPDLGGPREVENEPNKQSENTATKSD